MAHKEFPLEPSTLEIIDGAMLNWINSRIDANSNTNKGWKKVPVIWVSAERAFQLKRDRDLRDSSGTIILPVITLERASMTKDAKRAPFGNLNPENDAEGGSFLVKTRIKQDKTANFQNTESNYDFKQDNFPIENRNKPNVLFARSLPINNQVVYETLTVPQPVFMEIGYKIGVRTEYQEQMNEILTPFAVYSGNIKHFMIKADHHQYEAFFDPSFSPQNNVASMQTEERKYETSINIRVLGYLIGADKNQKQPKVVYRETAAVIAFNRERTIFGDIPEHIDDEGFYRE
tara:strand:+ start:246 stop:1112 length:867 start_codon:yes stop_codon:yes gene_type:complete